MSQLENDSLQPMDEDVSYDFLNLPNNLIEPKSNEVTLDDSGNKSPSHSKVSYPVALTGITHAPVTSATANTPSPPTAPLPSPPQVVPKSKSPNNTGARVLLPSADYVQPQPQQYRNIQPSPARSPSAPVAVAQRQRNGKSVVTVQSVGQIHVPPDQMKQVLNY